MAVRAGEKKTVARHVQLFFHALGDGFGELARRADRVRGDDQRRRAGRVLERERLDVDILLDVLRRFAPPFVAAELDGFLRRDVGAADAGFVILGEDERVNAAEQQQQKFAGAHGTCFVLRFGDLGQRRMSGLK